MTSNNFLSKTVVAVVEDDENLSETIRKYLSSKGFEVECFDTAEAFGEYLDSSAQFTPNKNYKRQPGVVLLDVRLKGMSGSSFFYSLKDERPHFFWPVCFMTGHGDIGLAVETMRHGAFDFITKPFEPEKLLDIIDRASYKSKSFIKTFEFIADYTARVAKLTDKELKVMQYIVRGNTNKEISEMLNNSTRTIELHRSRIFDKMSVNSATELATLSERYTNQKNGGGELK